MARCGWCKAPNLDYTDDGMLEPHPMLQTKKMCKGYDNPSLVLVRSRAEMSHRHYPEMGKEQKEGGDSSNVGFRQKEERINAASAKRQRVNVVRRTVRGAFQT